VSASPTPSATPPVPSSAASPPRSKAPKAKPKQKAPSRPGRLKNSEDPYPQPPVDEPTDAESRTLAAFQDALHQARDLEAAVAKDKKRVEELTSKLASDRKRLTEMTVEAQVRREVLAREARQLYIGATTSLSSQPIDLSPVGSDAAAEFVEQEKSTAEMTQKVAMDERDLATANMRLSTTTQKLTKAQSKVATLKGRVDSEVREAILRAHQESADISVPRDVTRLGGGKLGLPLIGTETSPFGNRLDPYFQRWQLHAGLDIAAAMGTPIRAAAAGVVTQSGWNGGYGNYTCLNHGNYDGKRLTSCYAHQSRILVSDGQQVKAGEVIGLVGSTGASTGPHLHFEVRIGGRPVDPKPWL